MRAAACMMFMVDVSMCDGGSIASKLQSNSADPYCASLCNVTNEDHVISVCLEVLSLYNGVA